MMGVRYQVLHFKLGNNSFQNNIRDSFENDDIN